MLSLPVLLQKVWSRSRWEDWKLTALRSSLNGLQSRWRWSVDTLHRGSVPWLWCLNAWQCSTPTGTNQGHSPVQTCLNLGSMMGLPYKPVVSCHCFAQPTGTLVYLVNIQPWETHETSGLPHHPQFGQVHTGTSTWRLINVRVSERPPSTCLGVLRGSVMCSWGELTLVTNG